MEVGTKLYISICQVRTSLIWVKGIKTCMRFEIFMVIKNLDFGLLAYDTKINFYHEDGG
jgi:hypothetical protein